MTKVKVCRVQDPATAAILNGFGVDYVGVHLVEKPTPDLLSKTQSVIACCTRIGSRSKPVLVLKNLTIPEIIEATNQLRPASVQLHDRWSCGEIQTLRKKIPLETSIIAVVDPITTSTVDLLSCVNVIDAILLDHFRGGTGQPIDATALHKEIAHLKGKHFFIAGGLNSTNVSQVIKTHEPYAVDVQSFTEYPNQKGKKNFANIRLFIEAVRNSRVIFNDWNGVSSSVVVSLTDAPEKELNAILTKLEGEIDGVHFDHSDGSPLFGFQSDCRAKVLMLQNNFSTTPYDIHFFSQSKSDDDVLRVIDSYRKLHPLLRQFYFYIDANNADVWPVKAISQISRVCRLHGVDFTFAFQARALTEEKINYLKSIIESNEISNPSIVGLGPRNELSVYKQVVTSFCAFIKTFTKCSSLPLTIDRGVTIEKLHCLVGYNIKRAIVGGSALSSRDPIGVIREIRSLLA